VIATVVLVLGCASRRHFEQVGSCAALATTKGFYVVVPGATERVSYDHLGGALIPGYAALNYEDYAKGRVRETVKLDVPIEIVKYLRERDMSATLGPAELAPSEGVVIISYDELWGWDMRPIIKTLEIRASTAGRPTEEASVKFEEMSFFNTQPVASSVVPAMMKVLFKSADRTAGG
jgi:hypothetical protein